VPVGKNVRFDQHGFSDHPFDRIAPFVDRRADTLDRDAAPAFEITQPVARCLELAPISGLGAGRS
jgi:hypothetical protein